MDTVDQYGGSSWKFENVKSLSVSFWRSTFSGIRTCHPHLQHSFRSRSALQRTGEIFLQSCSAVVLCIRFVHWSIPHCNLYRFPGCSNLSSTHSNRSWMQASAFIGEVTELWGHGVQYVAVLRAPRTKTFTPDYTGIEYLSFNLWIIQFSSTSRISASGLRVPEKIERNWGTG